jgi:hypothetical protein
MQLQNTFILRSCLNQVSYLGGVGVLCKANHLLSARCTLLLIFGGDPHAGHTEQLGVVPAHGLQ